MNPGRTRRRGKTNSASVNHQSRSVRVGRVALAATVVVIAAFAVVRTIQVMRGSLHPLRAGTEIMAVLGAAAMVFIVGVYWVRGGRRARVAQALTIAAWSACVLVPMWTMGHLPAPLFDDTLGGAEREKDTAAADKAGIYWLEVSAAGHAWQGEYWLHADVAGHRTTYRRRVGASPSIEPIQLDVGQSVRLFAERAGGALAIQLRLASLDRRWVMAALGIALLVAAGAEIASRRAVPGLRGATTFVVATTCAFIVMLDPADAPTGKSVLGVALAAVLAGGLVGGVWSATMLKHGRGSSDGRG